MDCNTCKNKTKPPETVSFFVHESVQASMERTINRLWIAIVLLIVMLVGTNGAWIWYESQFSDIVTTIEAEQDGSGVNIVSGGDLDYGAESENQNP